MTDVYLSQLDERPLLDLNKFEPRKKVKMNFLKYKIMFGCFRF